MYETNRPYLVLVAGLMMAMGATRATAAAESNMQGMESDRAFLTQARSVNELELRLGRLATERATTPEVKAMGNKMVQKHTEFGQQLADLAKEAGSSADPELSPDQQAILSHVESQSGPEFDSTFKRTVDDGHQKELAMYQEEIDRAADPRLRSVAEQRVAALKSSMGGAPMQQGTKY